MRLGFTNAVTVVEVATADELQWLEAFLTFTSSVYRGRGYVQESWSMLEHRNGERAFLSGVLPLVERAGRMSGKPVEVVDRRVRPNGGVDRRVRPNGEVVLPGWLRPYQREALEVFTKKTRGILHHVTGSGKGTMACALMVSIRVRWLFLVHRGTIILQTAERYRRLTGENCGVIGDGAWSTDRVTFATFQSLWARFGEPKVMELLSGIEGVIFDECHVLPSKCHVSLARSMRNAYWRCGTSGTPLDRSDERSMLAVGLIGPVVHTFTAAEGEALGVLSRPVVRFVMCPQTWGRGAYYSRDGARYAALYRDLVARSVERDDLTIRIVKKATKPCLVFVKSLEHGRRLTHAISAAGFSCMFIEGKTAQAQRIRLISALEEGHVDVVVATVSLQEGADIPELRSVVNTAAGRSVIAALQRIGRGMRRAEGKTTFEVWDFYDLGSTLEGQAKARVRTMERAGHTVSLVDDSALDSPP